LWQPHEFTATKTRSSTYTHPGPCSHTGTHSFTHICNTCQSNAGQEAEHATQRALVSFGMLRSTILRAGSGQRWRAMPAPRFRTPGPVANKNAITHDWPSGSTKRRHCSIRTFNTPKQQLMSLRCARTLKWPTRSHAKNTSSHHTPLCSNSSSTAQCPHAVKSTTHDITMAFACDHAEGVCGLTYPEDRAVTPLLPASPSSCSHNGTQVCLTRQVHGKILRKRKSRFVLLVVDFSVNFAHAGAVHCMNCAAPLL
jgi:hypothetical protein